MAITTPPKSHSFFVEGLEAQLKRLRDPMQRLLVLDQLAAHYVFTRQDRAAELLDELRDILQDRDLPDYELNYRLYRAGLQNLRYEYAAAEAGYREALDILEERGTIGQIVETRLDYVGVLINQGEMDLAEEQLQQSAKLLKNFPDERLLSRVNCRRGFIQLHFNNYSRAIESFLAADGYFNRATTDLSIKDYYFMTLIYSGLGAVYERSADYKRSANAYRNVVTLCERLDMRSRLAWHYLNLGNAFLNQRNYQDAEQYFRTVLEFEEDSSPQARAGACANLGICALEQEHYEAALELFSQAEGLYLDFDKDDYKNLSVIAYWRGLTYVELDRLRDALKELETAHQFAERVEDYFHLSDVSRQMASIYADLGDFRRAYELQTEHDRWFRDYQDRVNRDTQRELELKYEAKSRAQETERLKLEAAQLQLKALRAQMNPHFLYNALNSIQAHISGNDPSTASRYLAKFAKLMRQSLEYSETEAISLEDEIEFIRDYLFINQHLRFEGKLEYTIHVDDEIEEDIFGLPTMILQPYVENAIEHGLRSREHGHIQIEFRLQEPDTMLCIIEDNGIGRSESARLQRKDPRLRDHRSHGTRITEQRLRILHQSLAGDYEPVRTIDLKDEQGAPRGTRIELFLPVIDLQVT
jgi:tetratricopeptide (TPR) repeat protein